MKLAFLTIALSSGLASAATVSLDTSAFDQTLDITGISGAVTISNFSVAANSNRTLVVTVAGERSDSVASLKFGTTDMVLAAFNQTGQTYAGVYYLDLADTGASIVDDISLTWSSTDNGVIMGAISLFNVQSGGPIATDDGGNDTGTAITLSYGAASAGDMVVESAGSQSMNNSVLLGMPGSLTAVYNNGNHGSGGMAAGYGSVASSGSLSNTWTFTDVGDPSRVRAAGALFTAVPEPSPASSLIGLGIATALLRRRRA